MSDENNVDPLSWLLPFLWMKCCGKFNAGTILSFLSGSVVDVDIDLFIYTNLT